MAMSENRMRGIFLGGLVGGLASALPFISAINCFCCLWAWFTGGLAVALVAKREELPKGQAPAIGAMAGAFAGLVTSTLQLLYSLTIGPSIGNMIGRMESFFPADMPEYTLNFLEGLPEAGFAMVAMHLVSAIFLMGIFAAFGALGGMLYQRFTRPPVAPAVPPLPGPDLEAAEDAAPESD